VEPIVAGLDGNNVPYVASTDLIGCPMEPSDFVVGGTSSEQLYGMCESLWRPDMEPEDLFEAISQALLNAQDRDALAGWGGVVHIMYVYPGWRALWRHSADPSCLLSHLLRRALTYALLLVSQREGQNHHATPQGAYGLSDARISGPSGPYCSMADVGIVC
jgi:hypothetical protein